MTKYMLYTPPPENCPVLASLRCFLVAHHQPTSGKVGKIIRGENKADHKYARIVQKSSRPSLTKGRGRLRPWPVRLLPCAAPREGARREEQKKSKKRKEKQEKEEKQEKREKKRKRLPFAEGHAKKETLPEIGARVRARLKMRSVMHMFEPQCYVT